jgi:hypothetical protein
LHHTGKVRIEPQGLSTWQVKEGFLYSVFATKKMDISLHDAHGRVHKIQIEGDRSLQELAEFIRAWYHGPSWNKIIIARQDGQPFWIENKVHYTLATQYDPDSDTRP